MPMDLIDLEGMRPPRCEEIHGKRRRQCQNDAEGIVGYQVTTLVTRKKRNAEGRVTGIEKVPVTKDKQWVACRKHKNRARRNGGTILALYTNGAPF